MRVVELAAREAALAAAARMPSALGATATACDRPPPPAKRRQRPLRGRVADARRAVGVRRPRSPCRAATRRCATTGAGMRRERGHACRRRPSLASARTGTRSRRPLRRRPTTSVRSPIRKPSAVTGAGPAWPRSCSGQLLRIARVAQRPSRRSCPSDVPTKRSSPSAVEGERRDLRRRTPSGWRDLSPRCSRRSGPSSPTVSDARASAGRDLGRDRPRPMPSPPRRARRRAAGSGRRRRAARRTSACGDAPLPSSKRASNASRAAARARPTVPMASDPGRAPPRTRRAPSSPAIGPLGESAPSVSDTKRTAPSSVTTETSSGTRRSDASALRRGGARRVSIDRPPVAQSRSRRPNSGTPRATMKTRMARMLAMMTRPPARSRRARRRPIDATMPRAPSAARWTASGGPWRSISAALARVDGDSSAARGHLLDLVQLFLGDSRRERQVAVLHHDLLALLATDRA